MTPTTTTYALLALLGIKPWSSYELTKQARRSLRYVWPNSEANLYREQRRLVALRWADVTEERVGARKRTVYKITRKGKTALRTWLRTPPQPATLEIEGALRAFFADAGEVGDLARSLRATASASGEIVRSLATFAEEYLAEGGPFPDRLHVIAMAMDLLVRAHVEIERFCVSAALEVSEWPATAGLGMTEATRVRFEQIALCAKTSESEPHERARLKKG